MVQIKVDLSKFSNISTDIFDINPTNIVIIYSLTSDFNPCKASILLLCFKQKFSIYLPLRDINSAGLCPWVYPHQALNI